MTENGKAQIQALGAGLVGFVVVVGAGALLMLPHRSAIKAPAAAAYPAVDVVALSAPAHVAVAAATGAPMGETGAGASSPAPLLPESERAAAADAAPAAASAAPAAAQAAAAQPDSSFARKLVVSQHLDGTSSAHSSARATVASAPASPAKRAAPARAKKLIMPKLDLSQGTQGALASVHYGVSNRAELMGRAAGPVYNFAGKAPTQAQAASTASGAISQVNAAAEQIDASNLDESDKAKLKGNLDQVRQAVQAGGQQ